MVCRLQIPTNEQNIAPVCDFTISWCLNHGLSKVESIRFTVAVSELITDIILFAYPENSRENFEIEYHYSFPNLEIVVSELGEPFDPDKHTYDAKKAREENNFEGAGLLLMKELSDEFSFINKGKEGKEFRLSKKIEIHDIDELLQQSATLREPEVDRDQQEIPHKDIDEFTVSRIRSADAEEIAKIFYRTYEYSYFKEDMYLPKKIEEAVLSKEKLGVIARKEDGEAIGYFGVMQKEDSDIAELGEAIVTPSYRRNGVMTSMMNHLIEILKEQGVTALFAKAVTNHLVSQKVNHKFGYETTAILLALSENIKYKGFDEDYPQPISAALEFLPLIYPRQKSVYLPEKYKDIILETYEELGLDVEPIDQTTGHLAEKSDIDLNVNYTSLTSLIVANKYGKDFQEILSNMVSSLEEKNPCVIYLDLPLENESTPEQFSEAVSSEFIYSGLMPQFHRQSDYLRLQKVYSSLDPDIIEIYSDFGNKIKSLVVDEYHRHT